MPPVGIWQLVISLGVGGFAVFVFYLVVQRFGTEEGQGFQLSKLGPKVTAALAVMILLAITIITLTALLLFAPRDAALITITIEGRDVETTLPPSFSPTTGAALQDSLAGIEEAVESHDWERFLTFVDPENLAFQRSLGVDNAQYIEEALGFNTVAVDLPGERNPSSPFGRLNSIERFDIFEVEASDLAAVKVNGVVSLQGGKQRPFSFELTQYQIGEYRFSLGFG